MPDTERARLRPGSFRFGDRSKAVRETRLPRVRQLLQTFALATQVHTPFCLQLYFTSVMRSDSIGQLPVTCLMMSSASYSAKPRVGPDAVPPLAMHLGAAYADAPASPAARSTPATAAQRKIDDLKV